MPASISYGDFTDEVAGWVSKEMLVRPQPNIVLEKFGKPYVMPKNATDTAIFHGYERLPVSTEPLVEGVTPQAMKVVPRHVVVKLEEYGGFIRFSNRVEVLTTDPVISENAGLLGDNAMDTMEAVRYGRLKACSHKLTPGGVARGSISSPINDTMIRLAVRDLKRSNARPITSVVSSGPNFGTTGLTKCYVAVCHPDLQPDIEALEGFVGVEKYASSSTVMEGEIGKKGEVRFVTSTACESYPAAGAASATMIPGSGPCDVYPVLIFGKDAYGTVVLKGENSLIPTLVLPKPSIGDELGQKGSQGWRTFFAAVILDDRNMVVLEVACTL